MSSAELLITHLNVPKQNCKIRPYDDLCGIFIKVTRPIFKVLTKYIYSKTVISLRFLAGGRLTNSTAQGSRWPKTIFQS